MSACPHTGVSVPECSCPPCLRALLAEHSPDARAQQDAPADVADLPRRIASRLSPRRLRRAA